MLEKRFLSYPGEIFSRLFKEPSPPPATNMRDYGGVWYSEAVCIALHCIAYDSMPILGGLHDGTRYDNAGVSQQGPDPLLTVPTDVYEKSEKKLSGLFLPHPAAGKLLATAVGDQDCCTAAVGWLILRGPKVEDATVVVYQKNKPPARPLSLVLISRAMIFCCTQICPLLFKER